MSLRLLCAFDVGRFAVVLCGPSASVFCTAGVVVCVLFLWVRRTQRAAQGASSAASDGYKRQGGPGTGARVPHG